MKFSPKDSALTRLEVLAIVAGLSLLAILTWPALAGGKPRSNAAVCANNLRQLATAALMYSQEEDGLFPPYTSIRWPQRFSRYYGHTAVLRCPDDTGPTSFGVGTSADAAPRSYLLNGFGDYYEALAYVPSQIGVVESAIPLAAQTILFGEKASFSAHFWMNFETGDDYSELEQARHGTIRGASPLGPTGGGSNHAMVDGSVQMLPFGQGLYPTNLWAVTEPWRTLRPF